MISLRPAVPGDARLLWRWANDRTTRAASYNPAPIPWKRHLPWLEKKLATPRRCRIYVAVDERGRPVGQVRFDLEARRRAVVGISVDRARRGKGVGTEILRRGCRKAIADLSPRRIAAYVKKDNEASLAAFIRAGFRRVRAVRRGGSGSVLFHLAPQRGVLRL